MIRLFIDNKEVALSEDTSFSFIRENPFIQKAGDYSYDIDIDLSNKNNAQLYAGFKRSQNSFTQKKREVKLYNNVALVVKGIEVILSVDAYVAKIQVVGNTSQLNYDFDDSISIRDLDLGTITLNKTQAAAKTKNFYPASNVAYPIIVKKDDEVETFILDDTEKFNYPSSLTDIVFDDKTDLMPQPYLMHIIYTIVDALGYSIGINDIDVKYRHLIIVQNYSRSDVAKMLPNWTVAEFITEIEKFFNVVFEFDSTTNKVNIVSVYKFYSERASQVCISGDKIIDSFSVDISDDTSSFQTDYSNVGYQLPSTAYWKTQSLDEETLRTSDYVTKNWSFTTVERADYKHTIYYDSRYDIQYIQRQDTAAIAPILVNQFAQIKNSDTVSTTTLRIRPAKICSNYYIDDQGTHVFLAPTLSEINEEPQPFIDYITNRKSEAVSECLDVAFFLGNIIEWDNNGNRDVSNRKKCQCITTHYFQLNNIIGHFTSTDCVGYDQTYTLRLTGTYGRHATEFINDISIDTTHLFRFTFKEHRFLDPRSVFIIDGRKYYCKSLEYSTNNSCFEPYVVGEFYPAL